MTLYPARDLSAQIQPSAQQRGAPDWRESGSWRTTAGPGRLLRLLPAVLAAYELRYLVAHLAAYASSPQGFGSHSATLWPLVPLAVVAGVLLRDGCRGVLARTPRPRWSLRFVGSWMLCSALLAGLLAVAGLVHVAPIVGHAQPLTHVALVRALSSVPAVLAVGLLMAVSLCAVRRLLFAFVRERRWLADAQPPRFVLRLVSAVWRPAAAPLRAGWSDRGPPPATSLLAAF